MLMSGLSGNEIYCLAQKGWSPGNIVVGNSVYSLGLIRGITSGLRTLAGGEIGSLTELIVDGRHAAIGRLEKEAQAHAAHGLTGVASDLKSINNLMEFLALGSAVHGDSYTGPFFSTACTGQDLFCQIDAGYDPRHFVMGNVAYAPGHRPGHIRQFEDDRPPRRSERILQYVQPYQAPRAWSGLTRGRQARVQRCSGRDHADSPVWSGCPRDADGGHRVLQRSAWPTQGTGDLGADGRGALEPHPDGLRRRYGWCWGRLSIHSASSAGYRRFSSPSAAARSTRSPASSTTRGRTAWSTSVPRPRNCAPMASSGSRSTSTSWAAAWLR